MKLRSLLVLVLAGFVSSVAYAGFTQPFPVVLDLENRIAQGDMATARFSDNDFEFIGCGTRNILQPDGTIVSFGFCQAGVEEDESFTCFTTEPALVEKMSTGDDYSFVTFSWNEDEECIRVGFSTQSFYIPQHLPGRGR